MEATVQCFCLRLSERKMPNNVFFFIMLTGRKRDMSELNAVCLVSMTGLHTNIILSPARVGVLVRTGQGSAGLVKSGQYN